MPLMRHQQLAPAIQLGIWSIKERESFFLQRLKLRADEKRELSAKKGLRRLEWLAGRLLLRKLLGPKARIVKDSNGKPYEVNGGWHISLSHSKGIVAAIVADRTVGIDVQAIFNRIENLAFKFLNDEEWQSISNQRLHHLHVYWGAKEALYKAIGNPAVLFKDHIRIKPFAYELAGGYCQGAITKNAFYSNYVLGYEALNDHILVYGIKN